MAAWNTDLMKLFVRTSLSRTSVRGYRFPSTPNIQSVLTFSVFLGSQLSPSLATLITQFKFGLSLKADLCITRSMVRTLLFDRPCSLFWRHIRIFLYFPTSISIHSVKQLPTSSATIIHLFTRKVFELHYRRLQTSLTKSSGNAQNPSSAQPWCTAAAPCD